MKFGIEVEFFGTINEKIVDVSEYGIPHDEYPVLAEARGNPHNCVFQAVGSVRAEIDKIAYSMQKAGIQPLMVDWHKRDRKLDEFILRKGLHKNISYRNLHMRNMPSFNRNNYIAGLHISLTDERTFDYLNEDKARLSFKFNPVFDFPFIFNKFDKEFEKEISDAKRTQGFYEVKKDGRVEYRSLPATAINIPNFAQRISSCIFSK